MTSSEAMAAVFGGLRPRGKLLVVGASMDPIAIPAAALIGGSKAIVGHASTSVVAGGALCVVGSLALAAALPRLWSYDAGHCATAHPDLIEAM